MRMPKWYKYHIYAMLFQLLYVVIMNVLVVFI
jgi:hypothetical protein